MEVYEVGGAEEAYFIEVVAAWVEGVEGEGGGRGYPGAAMVSAGAPVSNARIKP
jgi:hypothetical protein